MFRKMPLILLLIIFSIVLLNSFIPVQIKSLIYTLSLNIKSLIITLLPIIIFGLLFKVMMQLAKNATKMILIILGAVICSNFISTLLSYVVGTGVYNFDMSLIVPKAVDELPALWQVTIPKWISNDKAMYAGILFGLSLSFFKPELGEIIANLFDNLISFLLKGLTYIIPLFVAGFVVKLAHEGVIVYFIKDYALIFSVIALAQFTYIALLYFITNPQLSEFILKLKNMLPAAIAGFSTMSSAAAMPLTIIATEKNAQNPLLAQSVIPATVNIHLIGDCFAIPILAYAIMNSFGVAQPLFINYIIFACFFVLAKFSVAAVPGGGIIVMLPILETYLGFNAPMLSLITALYILFDPVITCANVLGNGSFAMIIDKLQQGLLKRKQIMKQPTG